MNYILNQINRKINFLKSDSQKTELRVYYQAKFEFSIIFILGYLWNKNLNKLGINEREYVINCILKPSIGTIVAIIRKLDTENEFFGNKKLKKLNQFIDDYPSFRNEKIGHGFSFEDDLENYLEFFEDFFEIIEKPETSIIFSELDIIKVTKEEPNSYKGIAFKPDGASYLAWSCPKEIFTFNVNDIYLLTNTHEYLRISPFILIETESEIYSFCSIEEKLTGRTKFNRLLKTAFLTQDVNEFERLSILTDGTKRKSANGTVINIFENNFKKYIDVGITKNITNFLEKNRASVFATIWGHGGVGKTASIQRVCEILCNQEKKIFDYIIFLSAKDRYYNYYQGKINPIIDGISTLEDILSRINTVIFNNSTFSNDAIINYTGKLLIIIDDFETFSKDEKARIISFIKQLDINHHKVVLTTRAATLITGEEIQTKELNEEESIVFLQEALKNEIPSFNIEQLKKEVRKKNFEITSGRPLFILQLGIFSAQRGTMIDALNTEIKSTKEAINFLYDRLYDYLSLDAKNMFLGISLLVEENDLTGLINNLKFILSKEDKEDEFQNSLNELIKLKIITLEDKDFFKVYSPEIYKLMKLYYQNKGPEFDGNITNRFNLVNTEKGSSTEIALLENADASRLIETESEVENKYRYILNREKAPYNIKRAALLNFAKYLISHKAKTQKALKLFQDYFQVFKKDSIYIESYSASAWIDSSPESKYLAIQIIQDYFTTKPKLDQESYLELLGMLTTYKSIMIVSERDEIKGKLRFKEITTSEYDLSYKEQKERLKEIYKYPAGHLYNIVREIDLMTLTPNCRNLILDGLTHYVEIAIRNNKRDIGKEVCEKIINQMPQNYHNPFIYKLNKISFIENPNSFENDINKVLTQPTVTLIGQRLKEAIIKQNVR
ncbi:NB-ARC domain-containing protein [Chitinophagaceae bacterium LWZ2-11]